MQQFLATAIDKDGKNLTGDMVGALMSAQEFLGKVENDQPTQDGQTVAISDLVSDIVDNGVDKFRRK